MHDPKMRHRTTQTEEEDSLERVVVVTLRRCTNFGSIHVLGTGNELAVGGFPLEQG